MGLRLAALAVLAVCSSLVTTARAGQLKRFPSFYEIALKTGTDKVSNHSYHYMYERYLPPFRTAPVRFLEIGLGCDMYYGPGRSFALWYQYFVHGNATIDFLERDGACTEKYKGLSTRGVLLVGDQGSEEHLQQVVERAQQIGGYDVIIDDGGHSMHEQMLSFKKLWPLVNPGGIYIIEDLQTSYNKDYQGGPVGMPGTTISFIKSVIDMLNCNKQIVQQTECLPGLRHLDCFEEACVFNKAGRRTTRGATRDDSLLA